MRVKNNNHGPPLPPSPPLSLCYSPVQRLDVNGDSWEFTVKKRTVMTNLGSPCLCGGQCHVSFSLSILRSGAHCLIALARGVVSGGSFRCLPGRFGHSTGVRSSKNKRIL